MAYLIPPRGCHISPRSGSNEKRLHEDAPRDAGDKADPTVVAGWLKASLKRDLDMAKLRIDWAPKFEKVLPKTKATRFIQIDRLPTLLADANLANLVPLAKD